MMISFRLKFQRREFNQSVMVKRMTNKKRNLKKGIYVVNPDIRCAFISVMQKRLSFSKNMRTADTYHSSAFQIVQVKLSHPFPCVQGLAKITSFLRQIYGTHFQSTGAETPVEGVCIFCRSSQTVLSNCRLIIKHFLCGLPERNKWLIHGRIWARKAAHEGMGLLRKASTLMHFTTAPKTPLSGSRSGGVRSGLQSSGHLLQGE